MRVPKISQTLPFPPLPLFGGSAGPLTNPVLIASTSSPIRRQSPEPPLFFKLSPLLSGDSDVDPLSFHCQSWTAPPPSLTVLDFSFTYQNPSLLQLPPTYLSADAPPCFSFSSHCLYQRTIYHRVSGGSDPKDFSPDPYAILSLSTAILKRIIRGFTHSRYMKGGLGSLTRFWGRLVSDPSSTPRFTTEAK